MRPFGAALSLAVLAAFAGFRVPAAELQPAAAIDNIRAEAASDGTVTITYDLRSDSTAKYAVSLRVSVDDGRNFSIQPTRLDGDIGAAVTPGLNKTITWNPEFDGYTLRIGSGALGLTEVPAARLRYRLSIAGGPSATSGAKPSTPPPTAKINRPNADPTPPRPATNSAPTSVPAAPGTIRVTSTPNGAIVQVDGQAVGVTPFEGPFPAGKHSVRVINQGYQDFVREIVVEARENTNVSANLTQVGPAPPKPVSPPPARNAQGRQGVNPLVWVGVAGGAAAGALVLAGGSDPPPPPPPVSCSFSINSSFVSFGSQGGSAALSVSVSPPGCANSSWSTSNGNSWISVSPSSGFGSGNVTVSASPNTSTSSRTGPLTIANQVVTVSQDGIPCSYTGNFIGGDGVPANSRNTQVPGDCANCAQRSITITASNSSCQWSIANTPTWFRPSNGVFNRTGSGTVAMIVTERNFTNADRTASFTVAGLTFTVRQCRTGC